MDEPTALALEKLTGTSIPSDESPEDKRKAIDELVDWLRNNEIPADVDGPTVHALANLTGQQLVGTTRKNKQKWFADSVEWLRSNPVNSTDVDEPTALLLWRN